MDEIAKEAQARMNKALDALRNELSTLRTGRANAQMLNNIYVDYYGEPTPINQICSISVPEPRQLLIKPYDKNDVKAVVAAIYSSDLSIAPVNEGDKVRLNIPPLTEDRRRDITKQARKYGEETKVAIRNVRREYMDFLKDDDTMSEDYQKRVEEDIQKVTDESVKLVDSIIAEKEKELMAI